MVHKIIPSIDKNALDGINIDGKLVTNPWERVKSVETEKSVEI